MSNGEIWLGIPSFACAFGYGEIIANSDLYTSREVAAKLLPASNEWTRSHVAGALEEIARWSMEYCGDVEMIDRATVVKEVREMNMAMGSRDRIITELEQTSFRCSWILQTFDAQTAGFRLKVLPNGT